MKKKPNFKRQQSILVKFRKNVKWRKPKGIHSKLRESFKGHGSKPTVGYGSPKKTRSLYKASQKIIKINNINDLKDIDKNAILVISRILGQKKKIILLEKIKELNLKVLNIKVDDYLKKVKEDQEKKKAEKVKREEKKKKAKEAAEKKAKEKKEKEKPKTEEEVKKEETEKKEETKKILEKGSSEYK